MAMLTAAVVLDLYSERVPNLFIVLCSITSVYLNVQKMGIWGFASFLFRLLWPILLLFIVYLIGAIGAGDVKLLAVLSTYMDSKKILYIMVISSFFGVAIGIFRIILKGQLVEKMKDLLFYLKTSPFSMQSSAFFQLKDRGEKIHFTICILLAYVFCVCKEGVI